MRKLLIVLSVLLSYTIIAKAQPCGHNEQYYDSTLAPTCDRNCQDLSRVCRLTSVSPIPGCYCRQGYARNFQRHCVAINHCDRDCFRNEVLIRPRGIACENSCRTTPNSFPDFHCYNSDQRRCVCRRNYCRHRNGTCIYDITTVNAS